MILNVFELGLWGATVRQRFTSPTDRDVNLYCLRPHLFRWLSPSGSLYLQVQDENGLKIKNTETLAISSIGPGANYFHGNIQFLIDLPLKRATDYWVELKGSGYTYSASAFVGWCPDPTTRSYSNTDALACEFWERKHILKGRP